MYYTASGVITPVGGRPVHRLREEGFESFLALCTGRPPTGVVIPDDLKHNFDLLMMSIQYLKHVWAHNKLIIKQYFMH